MDWHRIEWSEVCEKLETNTEKVSVHICFSLIVELSSNLSAFLST